MLRLLLSGNFILILNFCANPLTTSNLFVDERCFSAFLILWWHTCRSETAFCSGSLALVVVDAVCVVSIAKLTASFLFLSLYLQLIEVRNF